jgi:hypothetical protein
MDWFTFFLDAGDRIALDKVEVLCKEVIERCNAKAEPCPVKFCLALAASALIRNYQPVSNITFRALLDVIEGYPKNDDSSLLMGAAKGLERQAPREFKFWEVT